jgi:hypothetical protein
MNLVPSVFKTISYTLLCSQIITGALYLDLETKKNKEIEAERIKTKHYETFFAINYTARRELEEFNKLTAKP